MSYTEILNHLNEELREALNSEYTNEKEKATAKKAIILLAQLETILYDIRNVIKL